jgi:Nucleotidyltransferase domain
VIARLVRDLPVDVPSDLVDRGRSLDAFYIPRRYPNAHAEGPPFEQYGDRQSEEAIACQCGHRLRPCSHGLTAIRSSKPSAGGRKPLAIGPRFDDVGYFGSHATGDRGVGSDVDLVDIVDATSDSVYRRARRYDTTSLPMPADLIVATEAEWGARAAAVRAEVVWVFPPTRPPSA